MFLSCLFLLVLEGSPASQPLFRDVAPKTGLNFNHFNGRAGGYHLPEIMGSGCALFDYDGDGDLDLYLVQSAAIGPGSTPANANPAWPGKTPPRDRLFRNDSKKDNQGHLVLAFTDVTDSSGIVSEGYGMGVAVGDIDNDGDPDLYITNLGPNKLFVNQGNGTFRDMTAASGSDDTRFSTSASFFDFDRDGFLDLFIANYVVYDAAREPLCYTPGSARDYCGPGAFPPDRDKLLRNRGDGTFEDVTARLKPANAFGPGLGVVTSDLNGDGWIDIYVANDGAANQLWINKKGSFEDEGLLAGVALNRVGAAEAGMGVTAGDFDGDGDDDLFLTHLMDETNTLYVNDGNLFFEDRTVELGLGTPSRRFTAFGTSWFDYDNDGWLDLITLNGAVSKQKAMGGKDEWAVLEEPNQLFGNKGGTFFEEIRDPAVSGRALVSRGAAFGDIDEDGDTDVLMVNASAPAQLLENLTGNRNHWIGLRLIDRKLKRDMLGAKVEVKTAAGRSLWRQARTDGSYCSAHDPRILVGLGKETKITSVKVLWPDGKEETWSNLPIDTYSTLYQGEKK